VRARDRERFEKLLQEERTRIAGELGVMEGAARRAPRDASGDLSAYSLHMADAGTDAMEREQSFMLAANLTRTLNEIEDALGRVRDGSYGVCGRCSRAIGVKRLLALPYAHLCLACQETVDQGRDSTPPADRP
jgi:DnaK suppressor protein